MFGYFLRRVDKRFQLERSLGTLPLSRDDAVARLEKLFALADAEEPPIAASDGPSASSYDRQAGASSGNGGSSAGGSSSNLPVKKEKSALRSYVEVRLSH